MSKASVLALFDDGEAEERREEEHCEGLANGERARLLVDERVFPFEVGLAFGAALLFLAGAGGRGEAERWASGPGEPSSAAEDTVREVLESFGVITNPGWGRTALAGRRPRLDDLLVPGTWSVELWERRLFIYLMYEPQAGQH